jgi:hypothetical protein
MEAITNLQLEGTGAIETYHKERQPSIKTKLLQYVINIDELSISSILQFSIGAGSIGSSSKSLVTMADRGV